MLSGLFSSQKNVALPTVGVSVSAKELHITAISHGDSGYVLSSVTSVPFDNHQPFEKQVCNALRDFEKEKMITEDDLHRSIDDLNDLLTA